MKNLILSLIVVFLVLCVPWFCVAQAGWFDSECKQAIIDSGTCDRYEGKAKKKCVAVRVLKLCVTPASR
ncbi:hypothetical protein LCGC14_2429080 [marine sediment metagenome]|uniref:Uncharacterized protein n=1 Tax=marine sediment metagenome TaxID=412755 RepID=A0A0F9BML5_9ZZZZ